MLAAIILDNKILGVLVADVAKDSKPSGYPEDSLWIEAPDGCHEGWSYDAIAGFKPPDATITSALSKYEEF